MTVSYHLFALITAALVAAEDFSTWENKSYNASLLQALSPITPPFIAEDPLTISFNNLGRLLPRQSCSTGYELCSNDTGCCPVGGDCCGGGSCCRTGYRCAIISGDLRCCRAGSTCGASTTTTSSTTRTTTRTTSSTTRTTTSTTPTSLTRSTITESSSSTTTTSSPIPRITVTTTEAALPPILVTVTNIVTVEGQTVTREIVTTPSANPVSTSSPPTTSSTSTSSTPTGAIVGGVIGGIAAIALLFGALMFFRRKSTRQDQNPVFDDLPQPTLPSPYQHLFDRDPQPPLMQQYGNSYFPSDAGGYPAPVAHPPQHPNFPESYRPVSSAQGAFPVPMPASTRTSVSTPRDLYTTAALQPSHTPDGLPHHPMDANSNSYGLYSQNNNNIATGAVGTYPQRNSVASSPSAHQQSFGTRYDEHSRPSSSAYGMYNNAIVGAGPFSDRNNAPSPLSAEREPYNDKMQGRKIFGRDQATDTRFS